MGRKQKVRYYLDSGDILNLDIDEIKAVLRAADEIIATGGRSILAKILKGSKDKKVIEHKLNECPSYGFYCNLTIEEITHRIDWMIKNWYIEIDYRDRLPIIVFTDKGWEIERETYANELLADFFNVLDTKDASVIFELKGKNRDIILLLIEKIRGTNDSRLVPLLKIWKAIEFKKVQKEIQNIINYLQH